MSSPLPIECRHRTLGPTGVATPEPSRRPATADLPIAYLINGEHVRTEHRSLSMARMFVNVWAAFLTSLFVSLSSFALIPMAFGYHAVVVTSASMEPSLHRSDVVILAPRGEAPIPIGSIVNVHADAGDVIHRVVAFDGRAYRTKGDANGTPDSSLVAAHQITGTGVFLVPFIGLAPVWADERAWWKLVGGAVLLLATGHAARRTWLRPHAPFGRWDAAPARSRVAG